MRRSVPVSTAERESSSTRMAGSLSRARASASPLSLTTGERHAALAHLGAVAIWEIGDCLVDGCFSGGFLDLVVRRIGLCYPQVPRNAARIQERILQHHADLLTQPMPIHAAHV